MVRQSSHSVECQEEEILHDDGGARDERDLEGGIFLKTGPCEVDIEQ